MGTSQRPGGFRLTPWSDATDCLTMQLIMEVVKHLEGAYALLIKSTAYPGELVACKRGSPLILGIKERPTGRGIRLSSVYDAPELHAAEALECFVASDASAVVEHTKRCALNPCHTHMISLLTEIVRHT